MVSMEFAGLAELYGMSLGENPTLQSVVGPWRYRHDRHHRSFHSQRSGNQAVVDQRRRI